MENENISQEIEGSRGSTSLITIEEINMGDYREFSLSTDE